MDHRDVGGTGHRAQGPDRSPGSEWTDRHHHAQVGAPPLGLVAGIAERVHVAETHAPEVARNGKIAAMALEVQADGPVRLDSRPGQSPAFQIAVRLADVHAQVDAPAVSKRPADEVETDRGPAEREPVHLDAVCVDDRAFPLPLKTSTYAGMAGALDGLIHVGIETRLPDAVAIVQQVRATAPQEIVPAQASHDRHAVVGDEVGSQLHLRPGGLTHVDDHVGRVGRHRRDLEADGPPAPLTGQPLGATPDLGQLQTVPRLQAQS